jgi:hypothetical protein
VSLALLSRRHKADEKRDDAGRSYLHTGSDRSHVSGSDEG